MLKKLQCLLHTGHHFKLCYSFIISIKSFQAQSEGGIVAVSHRWGNHGSERSSDFTVQVTELLCAALFPTQMVRFQNVRCQPYLHSRAWGMAADGRRAAHNGDFKASDPCFAGPASLSDLPSVLQASVRLVSQGTEIGETQGDCQALHLLQRHVEVRPCWVFWMSQCWLRSAPL